MRHLRFLFWMLSYATVVLNRVHLVPSADTRGSVAKPDGPPSQGRNLRSISDIGQGPLSRPRHLTASTQSGKQAVCGRWWLHHHEQRDGSCQFRRKVVRRLPCLEAMRSSNMSPERSSAVCTPTHTRARTHTHTTMRSLHAHHRCSLPLQ